MEDKEIIKKEKCEFPDCEDFCKGWVRGKTYCQKHFYLMKERVFFSKKKSIYINRKV